MELTKQTETLLPCLCKNLEKYSKVGMNYEIYVREGIELTLRYPVRWWWWSA